MSPAIPATVPPMIIPTENVPAFATSKSRAALSSPMIRVSPLCLGVTVNFRPSQPGQVMVTPPRDRTKPSLLQTVQGSRK
jgi:hypothetical protein